MLSQNTVIDYIKSSLGYPYVGIELSDEEILNYVKRYSLKTFSRYFPDKNSIGLNLSSTTNLVSGKTNEYYIEDPDGIEILNIVDIIYGSGFLVFLGQPIRGAYSHSEIKEWALNNEIAGQTKMFSDFNWTFEFKHPNIVRISPVPINVGWAAVIYERIQPSDFSGVSNEMQEYLLELSLADIMIVLGRIRKKYSGGNLRTPMGDIPIDGDILEEGKEKRREVLEKLEIGPLLNVTIVRG